MLKYSDSDLETFPHKMIMFCLYIGIDMYFPLVFWYCRYMERIKKQMVGTS